MDSDSSTPPLDDLLVVTLWTTAIAFERRLAAELATMGLSVASFRLIGEVMREPQGVRQGELARRLGVRPPTVSTAVAKLEADGIVSRVPDPSDPRARLVLLAENAPLLPGIDLFQRLESLLVAGLNADEQSQLRAGLSQLTANLQPPETTS